MEPLVAVIFRMDEWMDGWTAAGDLASSSVRQPENEAVITMTTNKTTTTPHSKQR
jgi:hypothetical protein